MTKELMIPNDVTPGIFTDKQKGIKELLEAVKKEVDAFKGDLSTEESRKEIKDFAKKINRSKTAFDDMGKEHVAKLKDLPKQIDAQRKLFREGMDDYKDKVLKPLTEWQEIEDRRIAKYEEYIATIIKSGELSSRDWQLLDADGMQKMLEEMGSQSTIDWQEFSERANQVIPEAVEKIETAIAKRKEYDKEQAELEALRKDKVERDKRDYEQKLKDDAVKAAALETERKAQQDKERVANEIKLAEAAKEKAEAELAASKQKIIDDAQYAAAAKIGAKKQAEAEAEAAVVRERERVAAEQEVERQKELEREANKKHKAKIHNDIEVALSGQMGLDNDLVASLIEWISLGKIPHVSIRY